MRSSLTDHATPRLRELNGERHRRPPMAELHYTCPLTPSKGCNDKVKPGAGGGWTEFDDVIPPGKSGRVLVGYEGGKLAGKFRTTWSIHSNDPTAYDLRLTIVGEIVPYVTVVPRDRIYLRGRANEQLEETCVVASHDLDPDFEVLSIESNIDDKIVYRLEEGRRKGEWRVIISKRDDYRIVASAWGTMTLHTNHPVKPERLIQINVKVEGDIRVQPPTMNFGPTHADGPPVRKTIKVSTERGGLNLTDWETSAKEFSVEIEEIEPGVIFKVHVTFTPSQETASQRGVVAELHLHTDDPDQPTVRVRLFARTTR